VTNIRRDNSQYYHFVVKKYHKKTSNSSIKYELGRISQFQKKILALALRKAGL